MRKSARAAQDQNAVTGLGPCGFCLTDDHRLCPRIIPKGTVDKDWKCPCTSKEHST